MYTYMYIHIYTHTPMQPVRLTLPAWFCQHGFRDPDTSEVVLLLVVVVLLVVVLVVVVVVVVVVHSIISIISILCRG